MGAHKDLILYFVTAGMIASVFEAATASPHGERITNIDSGQNKTRGWSDLFSPYADITDRRRMCAYKGALFTEGEAVATEEVCLRCRCLRGALVCYLRVCPSLPSPPPPGCVLVLKRGECCPELRCDDGGVSTNHISRAEPSGEFPADGTAVGAGCFNNGTLYGSGSAMSTSSLCQYCYCINGVQRCVRPRCLLPLDGCSPRYAELACCPVQYDCKHAIASTTTTSAPSPFNGCEVDGKYYPEGEKVIGVTKSVCDNCFCMRGLVRCVPLSCAPPILGCEPIVLPGKCCASSYNCTKKIVNVKQKLNILNTPEVKQEEVEQDVFVNERSFPDNTPLSPSQIAELLLNGDGRNNRRIDNGTEEKKVNGTIKVMTTVKNETVVFETFPKNHDKLNSTMVLKNVTLKDNLSRNVSTTTVKPQHNKTEKIQKESAKNKTVVVSTEKKSNKNVTNTVVNNKIEKNSTHEKSTNVDKNETNLIKDEKSQAVFNDTVNCTTEISSLETNTSSVEKNNKSVSYSDTQFNDTEERTSDILRDDLDLSNESIVTMKSTIEPKIINSKDEENNLSLVHSKFPSTSLIIPKDDDIFMVNVSTYVRTNTSVVTLRPVAAIPPEIEALLNISLKKNNPKDDYYDYDYKSSLPPSLPNLQIIPFLAIDAVLKADEIEDEKSKNMDRYATAYPNVEETNYMGSYSTNPREKHNVTAYPYITSDSYTTYSPYTEEKYPTSYPPVKPNTYNRNPIIYKQHINDKFKATTYKTILNENYDGIQYAQDKYDATVYPSISMDESQTETPAFPYDTQPLNLFSPPVETEGGFLPKEPPMVGPYYDLGYPNSEGPSVTEGSLMVTNQAKTNSDDCISNGNEYKNGELITEPNTCVACYCYYGRIHCQKGTEICNENLDKNEAPTIVVESKRTSKIPEHVTVAAKVSTPDPFRHVIHTEAPPSLHSLVGDMIPYNYYIRETSTSTSTSTTQQPTVTKIPTIVIPSKIVKNATSQPISSTTTEATTSTTSQSIEDLLHVLLEDDNKNEIPFKAESSYPSSTRRRVDEPPTTLPPYTTIPEEFETMPEEEEEEEFSFDSVLKLLLGDSSDTTTKATTVRTTRRYTTPTTPETTTRPSTTASTTTTTTTEATTTRTTTTKPPSTSAAPTPTLQTVSPNNFYKNTYKNQYAKPNRTVSPPALLHKNFTKPTKSPAKPVSAYPTVNRLTKLKYPISSTIPPQIMKTATRIPIPFVSSIQTSKPSVQRKPSVSPSEQALPFGAGLLKLAGCNIYGRMYRVGRIITELSGPCLECMCTEIGVQCRPLAC